MINSIFFKFFLACCVGTFANFASRILLSSYMTYVSSILLAYIIGMIVSYVICRWLVFSPSQNSTARQIWIFTLINGFALTQTVLISIFLTNYVFMNMPLDMSETYSHLIGILIPIFTTYRFHKIWTFR